MGEESQYSVRTELGEGFDTVKEGSVNNLESFEQEYLPLKYDEIAEKEGPGIALDLTDGMERSKSPENGNHRRMAMQAMLSVMMDPVQDLTSEDSIPEGSIQNDVDTNIFDLDFNLLGCHFILKPLTKCRLFI